MPELVVAGLPPNDGIALKYPEVEISHNCPIGELCRSESVVEFVAVAFEHVVGSAAHLTVVQ